MRFFLLIIGLVFSFNAFLQVASPYIQNFTNKVYGKNSNPEIYAIIQDNENAIIAGTSNGVLVYNGYRWKFVGVKDGAYVISIAKTKSGKIMLGSLGEFGELVKTTKGNYVYKSYVGKTKISASVWRTHTIDETVYFQTDNDIFIVKNGKQQKRLKAETSFHLSFKIGNEIYVRQREKGLYKISQNTLKLVDNSQQMKQQGLFAFFKTNGFNRYFFRDDLSANPIESSIYGGIKLRDGNYAVNTLANGIYILDKNFKPLYHYYQDIGLSDNDVKQIYQGSDGNLWLATNNGISYIEYQSNLETYNPIHGLQGDIEDLIQDNKHTFFASSKGVFVKKNGQIKQLNLQVPSWEFIRFNNRLFVATSIGIAEVTENQLKIVKVGNYNNIASFKQYLILTGPNGIEICESNFKTYKHYEIPIKRSLNILQDSKRKELWIGTIGSGLFRLKNDLSLEIYDDVFDGLNIAWTKPVILDNQLRFATKDGLHSFVYEEEIRRGLPDSLKNNPDFYRGIFEPMGSEKEIFASLKLNKHQFVLVQNELKEKRGNKLYPTQFSALDFGRINTIKQFSKQAILLCSSDGVSILYPDKAMDTKNFILSFEKILAANKSLSLDYFQKIDYQSNTLKITLKAPVYFHSTKVKYRYKIKGEQNNWSAYSSSPVITLAKLWEGSYTIYIQASNSFGETSNTLSYHFSINPPWYRSISAYLSYLVLLILSFYLTIKISKKRLQLKNEELEQIVKERTHEIALQKEEIEEKHKEITDSINYAERIQNALMMSDEHWHSFTKDYFIFFKPRDVVSGDFYWAYQNENVAIWTAADCTGHGVPGAFMSMLGIGFLNEIVIEGKQYEPKQILNSLRSKIIKALQQKGSNEERKDGMDIALCMWDKKSNAIKFAGANNPLILLTKNETKALAFNDSKMLSSDGHYLITLTADKMPVGNFLGNEVSFSQQEFSLDEGDYFFSFSDGFQDQFGGPDGKKFMIKRLKNLLLTQSITKISDYEPILEQAFETWLQEGKTEQIDDVCIVGVCIK